MNPPAGPAQGSSGRRGAVTLLRSLFGMAHHTLHGVLHGVSAEDARHRAGRTPPIEAQLAHIAVAEDLLVNVVARRSRPLLETLYSGRTGFNGRPPLTDWDQWAEGAAIDLAALIVYARGVFAATDFMFTTINDADLERPVDATMIDMGMQTVASILALALANCALHTGEISALKGTMGHRGYPEAQESAAVQRESAAAPAHLSGRDDDPEQRATVFDPRFDDPSEPELDPALAAELAALLG